MNITTIFDLILAIWYLIRIIIFYNLILGNKLNFYITIILLFDQIVKNHTYRLI